MKEEDLSSNQIKTIEGIVVLEYEKTDRMTSDVRINDQRVGEHLEITSVSGP